jgi:Protein of unknown function (DUF3703)
MSLKSMPTSVREVFKQELARATSAKSFDQTWFHLERAHIVSQAWAWPHTQTHWLMLLQAFRSRDGREISGQLVRLVVGGPGSLAGRYPQGNDGRARTPILATATIPEDLGVTLNSNGAFR